MKIILLIFMIGSCHYTFTYGLNLSQKQNKLAGYAVMSLAILGAIIPAVELFFQ